MPDRWVTFDCYGTLVDWWGGMQKVLEGAGVTDEKQRSRLFEAYFEEELIIEAESEWRPYRSVLQAALGAAAARVGVDLAGGLAASYVDSWSEWAVYPDVESSLGALRRDGWKLGILTNCDNDLWGQTAERLPLDFDLVVTAEDARCYKPDLGHFRRFEELVADEVTWIHAANSWWADIFPAARVGIPRVWVDRDKTVHPREQASRYIETLDGLPETVADLVKSDSVEVA